MKQWTATLQLFFFFIAFFKCSAQPNLIFNYNIDNGLPSNCIYGMTTDRHGYLWIATTNGVGCYNGYDFKIYNLANGLPTEDIWQVYEDKKGRIWLGSISNEIGYLYNNIYHKPKMDNEGKTLYPRAIDDFLGGIIFFTNYFSDPTKPTICVEKNDVIYKYSLNETKFGIPVPRHLNNRSITVMSNARGKLLLLYNNIVYKVAQHLNYFRAEKFFELDTALRGEKILRMETKMLGESLLCYSRSGAPVFYLLNLANGNLQEVNITKYQNRESIEYICLDNYPSQFYIISRSMISQYDFSNGVKFVRSDSIKNLVDNDVDGTQIKAVHSSGAWGSYIGTTSHGLYITFHIKNRFSKESGIDLHNYSFIGNRGDSLSFWWNKLTRTLLTIDKNLKQHTRQYNNINVVKKIVVCNEDTSLLIGTDVYYYKNNNGDVICASRKYRGDAYSLIRQNVAVYYAINSTGFSKNTIDKEDYRTQCFDMDRFNDLIYNSLNGSVWAYNYNKIVIHEKEYNKIIQQDQFPRLFGIDKARWIGIDNKFGNIFFKGNNELIVCGHAGEHKELFQNINLADALVLIHNETLIVTGRFGILFCAITGAGILAPPLIYHNTKSINYKFIYNCDAIGGNLLLSTDKGTYKVRIPPDSELLKSTPDSFSHNYRYVLTYRDTISNFFSGDTIVLDQEHRHLQFDVINPLGNGHVRYLYKYTTDSIWHNLNANEIIIPSSFFPDSYFTLSLKVYDDVWRSNEITLHLYISPHWYQTRNGRQLVWASTALLILLLLATAIAVTRKLVLRAEKKRSMQMELELKAIYAQINPHFIFNTLNSALLLVNKNKMEEAYDHISKFSRLLRSYIKSSRNKLTALSVEINNLRDYIELQQTRFKKRFEYRIDVDEEIDTNKTMIPALLIQPFVENAINHGILHKEGMGHLDIKFTTTPQRNEIICTIEDDGIGRKQSKEKNAGNPNKDTSYGDLLIKDLVGIFNKYENMTIEIKYTDKQLPLTGTIVEVQIKNPHYE